MEIIGILNVTPDSFSDGGKYFSLKKAIAQAKKLFAQGATMIDIGGESTRPGAKDLSAEEEWGRVGEILERLIPLFPGKISLDSRKPLVVERYLKLYQRLAPKFTPIINDVSGFQDRSMQLLARDFNACAIINHFPGKTIKQVHEQHISHLEVVKYDLLGAAAKLKSLGVPQEQIILDPGIGFGKTMDLNKRLLTFAKEVPSFNVLIGFSKKRFLGEHRFAPAPNKEAAKKAYESGAWGIRVHDPAWYQDLF